MKNIKVTNTLKHILDLTILRILLPSLEFPSEEFWGMWKLPPISSLFGWPEPSAKSESSLYLILNYLGEEQLLQCLRHRISNYKILKLMLFACTEGCIWGWENPSMNKSSTETEWVEEARNGFEMNHPKIIILCHTEYRKFKAQHWRSSKHGWMNEFMQDFRYRFLWRRVSLEINRPSFILSWIGIPLQVQFSSLSCL